MKHLWNNPWFTLPVLAFLAGGLTVTLKAPYGSEILWCNGLRDEPLNTFFRLMTRFGEIPAFVVFGLGLLFWKYRYTLLVAVAGLIMLPLVYFMKDRFGVVRPLTFFEIQNMRPQVVFVPGVEVTSGFTSFPSGHTMAAFALFALMTMMLPARLAWLGLIFAWTAILTGLSRIFLVQHFMVDVVGGAAFGLILAGVIWRIGEMPFFQNNYTLNKNIIS